MPDFDQLIPLVLLLAITGAFAGILAGLLGVGGGVVLVTAFYYVFSAIGYDSPMLMQICLATSLATIIVTSVRSVLGHNKKGAVAWSILTSWAPGIALGAVLGVLIAAFLRTTTLQAIFAILAIVVSLYMAFGREAWRLGEKMPDGPLRWLISPVVGFLSVLMGIGGGSFGVPLMTLHNVPMHRAVATSAGFGVIIAVPSVLGFLFMDVGAEARPPYTLGAVNVPAFLLVISMTLLTTPLGVKMAHALDPRPLRRVFAVFLMIVAANMLRKALGY